MYRILVTSVGSVIAYGIIESLRRSAHACHITGIDIYASAVGRYFCDDFVQGVRADDPGYVSFLHDLLLRREIDLVFFGMEEEIHAVYRYRDAFEGVPASFVLNDPALIALSSDKWTLHERMRQAGLGTIDSCIEGDYDVVASAFGTPFIVKPRRSSGSRGVQIVRDEETYQYHKQVLGENFMAQRLMGTPKEEYTSAVFGIGGGETLPPIHMRRQLNGAGTTHKAEVFDDPALTALVCQLARALPPIGPTNYQFRREAGRYYLLEINPRISSSTSMRTGFGYNEAAMCVTHYLLGKRPEAPAVRGGVALRYYKDLFVYEDSPPL